MEYSVKKIFAFLVIVLMKRILMILNLIQIAMAW
jgi:hypothetical protein